MPISVGFYKKIYQWLMDAQGQTVKFRPFLTKGNPYKSRIFLVSANAVPQFHVEDDGEKIFAEALINRAYLEGEYLDELKLAPREFQGSLQFEAWLEKLGESLIYTALNAYQLDTLDDAKWAKQEDIENYTRGEEIFHEVLEEFQPEILILQGTTAFNQFKKQFAENLVIYNPAITKVQLLEEAGPFAEMHFASGKKMLVFVTRSMSYFGQDSEKFKKFKENLIKIL
ncbi:RNA 2'-phosphotransferase [Solibacillus daqui]|uniref:RNA 2'-phosphotransferase n=1 Tax=Solibacillus daqui TaxID=2912187 RepID=UPI0023658B3C|nr:RNA 2'-phosphotransferase [Solibacillus daqui]